MPTALMTKKSYEKCVAVVTSAMMLLVATVGCSTAKEEIVEAPDDAVYDELIDDQIAMRGRDANLPTLFDSNQQSLRNDSDRYSKYSNPNDYSDRPRR